jgi:phosphoglycolate phosphatase-like HAD superfamily hydrolase
MIDIKGAIFDLDGTLFDSMTMWDSIAEGYLKSQGVTPSDDCAGDSPRHGASSRPASIFAAIGLTLPVRRIAVGINRMVEDFYFNRVQLKDGVAEALKRLKSRGVNMCVATATDRYLVEAGLRQTGISAYFGRIFTCTVRAPVRTRPIFSCGRLTFWGRTSGKPSFSRTRFTPSGQQKKPVFRRPPFMTSLPASSRRDWKACRLLLQVVC